MPAPLPIMAPEVVQLGGGLETRVADDLIDAARAIGVINFDFSEAPGAAVTRKGFDQWASCPGSGVAFALRKFYTSDPTAPDYMVIQRGSKLYVAPSNSTSMTLRASGLAQVFPDMAQVDDSAILVNGVNMLRTSNGTAWVDARNVAPQQPPSAVAAGAGSATGLYAFGYTFLYGANGKWGEGPLSQFSNGVVLSNQRVMLSLSAGPGGVTRRRIYGSSHSSLGQLYLMASVPDNTTTMWTSPAFTEEDLIEPAKQVLSPPPTADRLEIHGPYAFYVPVSDLSVLQPSLEGEWFRCNLRQAILDVRDHDGAHISDLKHLSRDILLIFTETKTWALYGADPRSWSLNIIYDVGMPRGGYRTTVGVDGRVIWKSRRHVYETNGYREGTRPISEPIEKLLDSLDQTNAENQKWLAVYYRKKGWYMLFAKADSSTGATGAFESSTRAADLSFLPAAPGSPWHIGVGGWNPLPGWHKARLCLVYDVNAGRTLNLDRWTVFDIDAIVAQSLEGPVDVGQVFFMPSTGYPEKIRRFERGDSVYADLVEGSSYPINAKVMWARRTEGAFTQDKQLDELFWECRTFGGATQGFHGYAKDLADSAWVEGISWNPRSVERMVVPKDAIAHHHAAYCGHSSAAQRLQVQGYAPVFRVLPRR